MIQLDRATHTYSTGRPAVTDLLTAAGLVDPTWFTEEARLRGTAVHTLCEYDDEGDLDESKIDERLIGYLQSYRRWRELCGFKPEWIEISVGNGLYAGTPDRVIVSRPRALYDLKTGAFNRGHAIQTALYVNLLPDPYSYSRFGIYLQADGSIAKVREFPKTDYRSDLIVGLSALNIYNWKRGK
jgi:hypothetical protein